MMNHSIYCLKTVSRSDSEEEQEVPTEVKVAEEPSSWRPLMAMLGSELKAAENVVNLRVNS